MNEPLRIFIGWDSRETVAWSVLAHSILRRSSIPVSFIPLVQPTLRRAGTYTRPRNAMETTEFSFTRFLVPFYSNYEGISVFMDCDMLCLADIGDLMAMIDMTFEVPEEQRPSVWCCQHDYIPKSESKFLGQHQTAYPRKNWSSMMIFNNTKCRTLTPSYVNNASGLELHRFKWLLDDEVLICGLPLVWNWLVAEYEKNPDAKILHYTNGTPCMPGYRDCDHADLWWDEYEHMIAPVVVKESVGA